MCPTGSEACRRSRSRRRRHVPLRGRSPQKPPKARRDRRPKLRQRSNRKRRARRRRRRPPLRTRARRRGAPAVDREEVGPLTARAESILDSGRSLSTVLAIGVVAVAIIGYAIGSSSGGGTSHGQRTEVAGTQLAAASVLIEAPPEWTTTTSAPKIPGLELAETAAFATSAGS